MINHRRHFAPKGKIQVNLDDYENDRKHDTEHGRNEAAPIMKQISECENID